MARKPAKYGVFQTQKPPEGGLRKVRFDEIGCGGQI
jgi:hypothetical protein